MKSKFVSGWHVAWTGGSKNKWRRALIGPDGEEVVIRAPTLTRLDQLCRAVRIAGNSVKALQKARSAAFVHGDCQQCNKALEAIDAALEEFDAQLHTSSAMVPGHEELYRGRM